MGSAPGKRKPGALPTRPPGGALESQLSDPERHPALATGRARFGVKGLFVDTSAWYPIADRAHADHDVLARALRERIGQGARIVTTNLVVAETHALLLRRAEERAALAFLKAVRQAPNRIEYITPEREDDAIRHWLERFFDRSFSLADACSFVVMTELGIREVLTLDHHFVVAGFVALPALG